MAWYYILTYASIAKISGTDLPDYRNIAGMRPFTPCKRITLDNRMGVSILWFKRATQMGHKRDSIGIFSRQSGQLVESRNILSIWDSWRSIISRKQKKSADKNYPSWTTKPPWIPRTFAPPIPIHSSPPRHGGFISCVYENRRVVTTFTPRPVYH